MLSLKTKLWLVKFLNKVVDKTLRLDIGEPIFLIGEATITIKNKDGSIASQYSQHNLVVNSGRNLILKLLKDDVVTGCEYIAIGDDSTAAVVGDTVLGNELSRATVNKSLSSSGLILTLSSYWNPATPASTITVREIGVFGNGATSTPDSGTLTSRVIVPDQPKTQDEQSLAVDFKYYFA